MTKPYRVAQFGTFEVENYGDLLFPRVLERELRERLGDVELTLFSPLAGAFPPDPSVRVHAIEPRELERAAESFDAFVVGGGDLISFRGLVAPVYEREWQAEIGAHSACWALPLLYRPPELPVFWNAPGVPYAFNREQALIASSLVADVDAISVRDDASKARLREAGVEGEIHVVPDTALLLRKLFPPDTLEPIAAKLLAPLGLARGEYLVFQIAPLLLKLLEERHELVGRFLERLGRDLSLRVLLLPIGYVHDDAEVLGRIHESVEGAFAFQREKLRLEEITALLAASAGFIGSSFHGQVASFAYDVPQLMINSGKLAKLEAFAQMIERPESCVSGWQELLDAAPGLLVSDRSSAKSVRDALCARVEAHFDRLAEGIRAARERPRTAPDAEALRRQLAALHLRLLHQEMQQQKERQAEDRARRAARDRILSYEQVITKLRKKLERRRRWLRFWLR